MNRNSENPYRVPESANPAFRFESVNYHLVRLGFQFIYRSILYAFFASLAVTALLGLALLAGFFSFDLLVLIDVVLSGGCVVAIFIGMLLCLAAPKKSERQWIGLTHAVLLGCVIFHLWGIWLSEYTPNAFHTYPMIFVILSLFIQVLAIWFFLTFCVKVASNSKSNKFLASARNCRHVAVTTCFFVLVGVTVAAILAANYSSETPFMRALIKQANVLYVVGFGLVLFAFIRTMLMLRTGINELSKV